MSNGSDLEPGTAVPAMTVIVGVVFVVFLFFRFVDWVGPSSGKLNAPEIGRSASHAR